MTRLANRLVLAVLCCWTAAALAQPPLPSLPFDARVSWVLPAARIAGRSVSVASFESTVDVEHAMAETRRHWRRDSEFDVIEGRSGEWRTLSRFDGQTTVTLLIQSGGGGGSRGMVSTWAPESDAARYRALSAESRLRALLPSGVDGDRTFASFDGGGIATTIVAVHEGPLSTVWSQTLSAIRAAGFEAIRPVELPATLRNARVGVFRRKAEELVVTMDARRERLGIVMHLIEGRP